MGIVLPLRPALLLSFEQSWNDFLPPLLFLNNTDYPLPLSIQHGQAMTAFKDIAPVVTVCLHPAVLHRASMSGLKDKAP